jgi:hypothetical protein
MTVQYFFQLNRHTPKDNKSYFDIEPTYTLGKHVSNCPITKFGVQIPLKTQALLATVDNTLDFLLIHSGWTPRQLIHVGVSSPECQAKL